MIRLFLPISNETIAQAIAEAAMVQAVGFAEAAKIVREGSNTIPAASFTVPAGMAKTGTVTVTTDATGAGIFDADSTIQTGIFWDATLVNPDWPDGWLDDYVAARWVLAGGVRSLEMAPWTARLDPRAMPRPSLALKPAASNPYALSVHLLA